MRSSPQHHAVPSLFHAQACWSPAVMPMTPESATEPPSAAVTPSTYTSDGGATRPEPPSCLPQHDTVPSRRRAQPPSSEGASWTAGFVVGAGTTP